MNKSAYLPGSSRLIGQAMLDAWLCGDYLTLSRSLEDVSSLSVPPADNAEKDRLDTLKAIAHQMNRIPDLSAPRAVYPQIGSWMRLLEHLADPNGCLS